MFFHTLRFWTTLVTLATGLSTPAAAWTLAPPPAEATEAVDLTVVISPVPDGAEARIDHAAPGFVQIAAQVRLDGVAATAGLVYAFDAAGRLAEVVKASDVPAEGFWTEVLPGGRIVLALVAPEGVEGTLTLVGVAGRTGGALPDGALDGRFDLDLVGPGADGFWADTVGAVAALIVGTNVALPLDGVRPARIVPCTGFLVAPDLLMTAAHCFEGNPGLCAQTVAIFGYQLDGAATLARKCLQPVFLNAALDVAVLRLAPTESEQPVILLRRTPPEDAALAVIQHPRGSIQMVSLNGCRILAQRVPSMWFALGAQRANLATAGLEHSCDTDSGSSGSPILGPEGLVGLHQGSLPDKNVGVRSVTIAACINIDQATQTVTVRKPSDPLCSNEV